VCFSKWSILRDCSRKSLQLYVNGRQPTVHNSSQPLALAHSSQHRAVALPAPRCCSSKLAQRRSAAVNQLRVLSGSTLKVYFSSINKHLHALRVLLPDQLEGQDDIMMFWGYLERRETKNRRPYATSCCHLLRSRALPVENGGEIRVAQRAGGATCTDQYMLLC
jgi:hypothetical protein